MKKLSNFHVTVEDQVFKVPVHVWINPTRETFFPWLGKEFVIEPYKYKRLDLAFDRSTGHSTQMVEAKNKSHCELVAVWDFEYDIEGRCTLMHELNHATFSILREALGFEDQPMVVEEFHAYFHEHLYGSVCEKIYRKLNP